MAISGVVRCGGGGKERGKRVEGPGRVETSTAAAAGSWELDSVPVVAGPFLLLLAAPLRERERERESE
jgi:hypothetical protein